MGFFFFDKITVMFRSVSGGAKGRYLLDFILVSFKLFLTLAMWTIEAL